MPRSGGTMSIPNTMVAGETALASDVNENFDDIADELTNSVAVDGQSTMTGQLKAASGTVASPGISFGADLDSGLYRIGADNVGAAVNGALVLNISTAGISITGTITPSGQIVATGTVSAPGYSFASDLDSGIYRIGANNIGVGVNGAKVLDVATTGLSITCTITPSGQIVTLAGTKTAPGLAFASDLDTGIYRIGANNLGISVGDTKIFDVVTTGVTITGTLTNSGAVTLQSTLAVTGASTLTGALTANNSAGITARNTVKAYGRVTTGLLAEGFNVASVVDNGTNHTITFTAAMADANY